MHDNSQKLMRQMMRDVIEGESPAGEWCVDIGALDVNGSYRALIEASGFRYFGVDRDAGPNVDLACAARELPLVLPERVSPVRLVISGQMLEHDEAPWETMQAIRAVLEVGGWVALVAPAEWPEHRYPVDCWRILPDGMAALCRSVGLTVLKVGTSEVQRGYVDCFCLARRLEGRGGHAV